MTATQAQVRHLIDRAVRIARDRRTVTCAILLPAESMKSGRSLPKRP